MDPIVTALIAGATFIATNVATESIKDAYAGVKSFLAGKLASLINLEEDPQDDDYRNAVAKELTKKGLSEDPTLLAKIQTLIEAIDTAPSTQLADAAIEISDIRAAKDVLIKRIASVGNVKIKNVDSQTGKVDIQDVSAGATGKK